MSCGAGCRCGSDLALLWLWCRLAAVALIPPLAWGLPYAEGVALKKRKKKKGSSASQNVLNGTSGPTFSLRPARSHTSPRATVPSLSVRNGDLQRGDNLLKSTLLAQRPDSQGQNLSH